MTTTDPEFRQDIADKVLSLPVAAAFGLIHPARRRPRRGPG